MAKTYYIGRTTKGAIIARASTHPDYTHAATSWAIGAKDEVIPLAYANFSRSEAGARKAWASDWSTCPTAAEVVALEKVDGAEYRRLTGKS